jgi:hypothetical protein
MKVLVACECSGRVRDAFLRRGHDAISCDLDPCEIGGPHYQGNVLDVLEDGWDLMIAHPPCTYLSRAGARWLYPSPGVLDPARYALGIEARELFLQLLRAPIERIAIENPTPLCVFDLPAHSQTIEPYEHGHPYSKRTRLWLRGLPPLNPTRTVDEYEPFLPSNTGGASRGERHAYSLVKDPREASRTFSGIAEAMAAQWGDRDPTSSEEGTQLYLDLTA